MSTARKIEIIETMLQESRKSLKHNSYYFLLWGILLVPAGLIEFYLMDHPYFWMVWPVVASIGGVLSMVHGIKDAKNSGVQTMSDRITLYTWGAFGFGLLLSISYSVVNHLSPHPMVLMLAGMSTFISGGNAKFPPLVWGGIALSIGAVLCAFIVPIAFQGLVFSISILLGYVLPGAGLRRLESA